MLIQSDFLQTLRLFLRRARGRWTQWRLRHRMLIQPHFLQGLRQMRQTTGRRRFSQWKLHHPLRLFLRRARGRWIQSNFLQTMRLFLRRARGRWLHHSMLIQSKFLQTLRLFLR